MGRYDGRTAQDLRTLLFTLGWSAIRLSHEVDAAESTVYAWTGGATRVPGSVWAYLDLVAGFEALAWPLRPNKPEKKRMRRNPSKLKWAVNG